MGRGFMISWTNERERKGIFKEVKKEIKVLKF
jgi:hypothetical protein